MNPGTIPVKTDKGRQEMAVRTDALDALQRRLLILVDGRRTVNDLGAYVRVGELDGALAHLFQHGFVAHQGEPVALPPPLAPGFSAQDAAQPVRAATSQEQFENVRAEASDFIHQRLGDAASPICRAVDRCASPQELRQVLRGVEVFVGQRLDAQTAQSFARHFGAMLL
ncbi:MAG: hypothetical protein ABIN37_00075 [Burkholderiaceae bacterium]